MSVNKLLVGDAVADAAIKYLNTRGVAARYSIDPRSVQRRVKEGLLPPPYYFGTRFPRWEITELDTHDRRMAMARVPNRGALAAAAKAKAAVAAGGGQDRGAGRGRQGQGR